MLLKFELFGPESEDLQGQEITIEMNIFIV